MSNTLFPNLESLMDSERLKAFDFETSSKKVQTGSVWQIGVYDRSGEHSFVMNPYRDIDYSSDREGLISRLKKDLGSFGEAQEARKSFNELRTSQYLTRDANEAIKFVDSHIDKNSVMLIHNVGFESKFMAQLTGEARSMSMYDKARFTADVPNADPNSRTLFTPPNVTSNRNDGYQHFSDYIASGGGDTAAYDKYLKAQRNIIGEYEKLAGDGKVGQWTIENMDIARALFAEAGQNLLIDKDKANVGLNMEFLAKHFLGQQEMHTAASDARQTQEVAKLMLQELSNMKQGNYNSKLWVEISSAQGNELQRQYNSAVVDAIDEFIAGGSTYEAKIGSMANSAAMGVLDRATGKVTEVQLGRSGHSTTLTSLSQVIDHVNARYKDRGVDTSSSIAALKGRDAAQARQLAFEYSTEHSQNSKIDTAKSIVQSAKNNPTGRAVVDEAKDIVNKITTNAKKILPKNKYYAAAAIGAGALFLASDGPSSEAKIEQMKKINDQRTTRDSLKQGFNIYEQHYHGSGFADYNERIGHGQY